MNWDNVRLILSIYTAMMGIYVVIGLGKFFCVKALYDLYDSIDRFTGYTASVWVVLAVVLEVLSLTFYYFDIRPFLLICLMIISILIIIGLIFSIVGIIIVSSRGLKNYHTNLKYKKNMR